MFLKWVKERPEEEVAKAKFGEKVVYFVRHGQSEANLVEWKDKENEELRDAKLTEKGKEQAKSLQAIVKQWKVQTVICSPLTRTIQTACLAFEEEETTPIISWPEVSEYYGHLPECQGRPLSVLRKDPQLLSLRRFADVSLEYIDADDSVQWWSRADDRGRLGRFLSWLSNSPETRVAVVTHWGFIRLLMDYVDCSEELELKNCTFVATLWQRRRSELLSLPNLGRVQIQKPQREYGVMLVPAASKGAEGELYAWVPPLLSELEAFFEELKSVERFACIKSLKAAASPYSTIATVIPFSSAGDEVVALQEILAATVTELVMKRREEGEPSWHPDAPSDSVSLPSQESLHLRTSGHNLALFYGLFFESQLLTLIVKRLTSLPSYQEAPHALRHNLYHLTLLHDNRTDADLLQLSDLESILSKYPSLCEIFASAGKELPSFVTEQLASIRWEMAVVCTIAGDWSTYAEVGTRYRLY